MTIKYISRDVCETCTHRTSSGCLVVESCPTDVLRSDEQGYPYISYPDDCHACFLCQIDCPNGAVRVTADITFPLFP